jgi:hypothetical protein
MNFGILYKINNFKKGNNLTEKSVNDFYTAIETQKEILETNKNYGLGLMRLLLQVKNFNYYKFVLIIL